MAGFNLFKVFYKQKDSLIALLTTRGLEPIGSYTGEENNINYECKLYYTRHPKSNPIKWVKILQEKFDVPESDSKTYSAVITIEFNECLYAAAFGTAHFFVSRFSDNDFGIDIASRILKKFKIKNSREFGGEKTKSIEMYNSIDDLPFEAGEAVNYIKGTPIEAKEWGENISCGQSVQLRKREFTVAKLHKLCFQLEAALKQKVVTEIPKSTLITDKNICRTLNEKLIQDMRNGNYMISISGQQLSGVAFIFADQCEYFLKIKRNEISIDETLSLQTLQELVRDNFANDYQRLLDSDVIAKINGEFSYSQKFITFIDYIDEENNHYLEKGDWYKFDTNYMGNLKSSVDKILFENSKEIFEFNEAEYGNWLTDQPENKKHYRERYLNSILERDFGYKNQDRHFKTIQGATVEVCDLYKSNAIYVVKIGEPQKLNYAIDQATLAARILERDNKTMDINGEEHKIDKLCLWLFVERKTNIQKISELRSLIFLMKLAHWRKDVLLSGLTPEIRISYRRN